MNLFKRFISEPAPTEQELAEALAFKNKLKYGEDIAAKYNESRRLYDAHTILEKEVRDKLKEIFKYKDRKITHNWTSFNISNYKDCHKSPIKRCIYISYFGDNSPEKEDKQFCICCDKDIY